MAITQSQEKMTDYYKIIGVDRGSTAEDIKKAYRSLALRFHPDRNSEPAAEEKFKMISEAYEVLGNEEKRREYDIGGNYQSPKFIEKNVIHTIFITLEEMVSGFQKNITYWRFVKCCEDHLCEKCKGTNVVRQQAVIAPKIPPGATEGNENYFSIKGEGNYSPITDRYGDLILTVEYLKHPVFKIIPPQNPEKSKPLDISCDVEIKLVDYLLTGSIKIKTLYSEITVKLTPSQIASGKARVPKHGLPDIDNKAKGGLYLNLSLLIPDPQNITTRERTILGLLNQCKNFK